MLNSYRLGGGGGQPLKLNNNIIKRLETYKYLGDLKDTKILWKKVLKIGEILQMQ